jgi:predicted transcriptional regulator
MSFTIELDEQTAAVVQELAAKEKRAAAEVIHDALLAYALQPRQRALPRGIGKYRSGHTDTAQHAREIIREAVEKGEWP